MNEHDLALEQTIVKLVEAKKYTSLRDLLATLNPADIAEAFGALSDLSLPLVFRLLPKALAAEAFVEMEAEQQETLIRGFSDLELKALVDEMYVDDAVNLVEEMPANVVSRILSQADPDTRKTINQILQYPEDSAGSAMTTEFVELKPDMTVSEAIAHIREVGIDKETINTCYVTDPDHHLRGVVSIRSLILAKDNTPCRELMIANVVSVGTLEDQEAMAQMFSKYAFNALPVVDKDDRMVGIVTMDDAMDILEAETTEDMEKMAAMMPSDRPYLSTGVFSAWRQRIPWLLALLAATALTVLVIRGFEHTLLAYTALIAYIPMLMDSGGNSGSQASVSVIRSLSLQEVEVEDLPKILWKEFRVAVLCGLTMSAATFGVLLLLRHELLLTVVISLSLLVTVVAAKLVGTSLPLLAQKLGFDPALMASPIITTVVDVLSLLIYLLLAQALLP